MSGEKQRFMDDELFRLTLQATVQYCRTYAENASKKRKVEFQKGLRARLGEIARQYSAVVDEGRHIENIEALSKGLCDSFSDCLFGNRFRIGPAQKALNLYLKYLWCLGKIGTPPHCPFDDGIIGQLALNTRINWTEIDDICVYKEFVAAARINANGMSLAEWELTMYNKVRHT